MRYQPLFNNLLVKPPKQEGSIITEPDPNEPLRATVVAVGRGSWHSWNPTGEDFRVPMEVDTGFTVLFFIRDAKKLKLDREDYYLLNQEDILVVDNG